MNLPGYSQMVKAMRECDPSYDGKFYVGVLTTGIYCLPSCKAKLPKLENGNDYLTACFESGFESFSGFRDAFLKEFGTSPGEIHAGR